MIAAITDAQWFGASWIVSVLVAWAIVSVPVGMVVGRMLGRSE